MGLSQEDVLGLLKQHGVEFEAFQHEPVMTADAQADALKGAGAPTGAVTKNLFVRDKKRRQYLITALPDTKVDLKVLSARLGCGKGGVSWGSEELLAESLQVEPGCVTPLAVANPSAKHVLLLLDAKLREAGRFFVHPIANSASVLLSADGLDTYLKAVGRQPIYVDLEADPKIDRDNPPDLKQHADSIEPPPKEEVTEQQASTSSGGSAAAAGAAAGAAAAKGAGASGAGKGGSKDKKGGGSSGAAAGGKGSKGQQPSNDEHHIQLTNVVQRTGDILDMVSQALLGKSAGEAGVDDYALRRLKADVQMQLTAFKNAAYTAGYNAGKGEIIAFATKQYA